MTELHVANSGAGVPVNLVTATFGPRYTWTLRPTSRHEVQVFGEGLAGITNAFSGYYPQAGEATESTGSLALQVAEGLITASVARWPAADSGKLAAHAITQRHHRSAKQPSAWAGIAFHVR